MRKLVNIRKIYSTSFENTKNEYGKVTVFITVVNTGSVVEIKIGDSDIKQDSFLTSLKNEIMTWKFEDVENVNDTSIIEYPFKFKSNSEPNKSLMPKLDSEKPDENQDQANAGEKFFKLLLDGEYKKAYKMIDPEFKNRIPYSEFILHGKKITDFGRQFTPEISSYMYGFKFDMKRKIIYYNYRFNRDVSKVPGLILEAYFTDEKTIKIGGFRWLAKQGTDNADEKISTTTAKEQMVAEKLEWTINKRIFKIQDISIIFFNNSNMLAIKVLVDTIPNEKDANIMAKPIVKHSIKEGFYKKAQNLLKDGKKLDEVIGVAFIDRNTHNGFRVQVKPEIYEN